MRFGCGLSRCGAFTVHLGGEPVRSCEFPVGEVGGREVVTLEGLGTPDSVHPLQQAFLDERAGQCGYCLPGVVMAAAHLLARNSQPAEAGIREALHDTLCRCGAHVRMVRAIQRAASMTAPVPNVALTVELARAGDDTPPLLSAASTDASDVTDSIDARLAISAQGHVTVYTGKVELGAGVRTTLAQIVADGLDVPIERVTLVMGDTRLTPDDGGTTGSKTLQSTGPLLQQVAAEARHILLARAATRLGVPVEHVQTRDGIVSVSDDPARSIPYGELAAEPFGREVSGRAPWQPSSRANAVGRSVPRVDLPAKLTGGAAFVHDLRLPGMLHGRLVRPHVRTMNGVAGSTVQHVDDRAVRDLPGLVAIVRNGSFVGVVAEREEQAIRAAEEVRVTWSAPEPLPDQRQWHVQMPHVPARTVEVSVAGNVDAAFGQAARIVKATYAFPIQAHASLGPSCAVADVRDDGATIYTSSQRVFGLRSALAPLLGLATEQVHLIHREGAGCYGHNGADDVSADAALLAQVVGRPVRVQWGRADEPAICPVAAVIGNAIFDATGVRIRTAPFTPERVLGVNG